MTKIKNCHILDTGINTEFDERFKKFVMKKVMKDIFLKLMFNILKIYVTFTIIYPFCRKE